MISSKKLSEQRQHLQDDRITIIFAKFLRMKWFLFFLMIPLGFYALSFTFTLLKVDIGVDKKFTNASISLHAREESLSEKFIAPNYQQMVTSLDDDRPVYQIEESSSKTFWPTIPDIHWNYMPRVFTFSNGESSWCLKKSESGQGLLFAKVHKAASSTLSGINLRIASHHNCASTKQEHDDSSNLRYRDRTKSFLYASIRDPAQRALSWQMYILSNHDQEITSEHLMTMFKQKVYFVKATKDSEDFRNEAGAQVGYLHPFKLPQQRPLWDSLEPDLIQNITLAQLRVKQILDFYDFILLVERLDESLVVLQLLLGLDATDIVYVSSKQSGGYSYIYGPKSRRGCHKLTKRNKLPFEVKKYLSSPEWYASNYQDFLLYKAVNQSLDLTIEHLGKDRFERALREYQTMMKQAKQECETKALFPCSTDGQPQLNKTNCYIRDWGCAYDCLDRLFAGS